jgi:hypothetical protein
VFDKRADPAFDVVSFIALGFFTVEIGTWSQIRASD